MTGHVVTTVIGNLTADPELRYTSAGIPVASFTIAATPRVLDRADNTFRDGEPVFLRCVMWRRPAENAADSLRRGMRVIAQGQLCQRALTSDGSTHTVIELDIDEVGPTLRYATVTVTRAVASPDRIDEADPTRPPDGLISEASQVVP
jgi:single-strand DNA-binding protein